MSCRFILRQVRAMFRSPLSNVLMYFLHVFLWCVVVVVVVEVNVSDVAIAPPKINKRDVMLRGDWTTG